MPTTFLVICAKQPRAALLVAGAKTAVIRPCPIRTATAFVTACDAHRNDPAWFDAKGLSGFVFQNPHLIAYHACPGRTLFFTVEGITLS
jgi:hypothetical protein